MASKSDYYDILGITKSSSSDEIKKAYRKKALEWHPDRHKGEDKEEAERKFKEINEAYQVLSDSQKRSAYDQFGHDAFSPGGGAGGFSGNPFQGGGQTGRYGPFTYTYTSSGGGQNPFGNFDFGDPFDIFESFFGGGNPSFRQKAIPRYSIKIDFMEAVNGTTKEVEIEGKKRKIKIPAGIDEGTRINFGDFTLSVNISSHEIFEREGSDIYVKVLMPYSLAVLGGEIGVPTLDGKELKLKIRPGTQSGSMIRLRGKGIKNLNTRGFGDEYIKLNILVPEDLSKEQKEVIEKMENVCL